MNSFKIFILILFVEVMVLVPLGLHMKAINDKIVKSPISILEKNLNDQIRGH